LEVLDVYITSVSLQFWQVIAFPGPHVSTRSHPRKREGLKLLEHFENIIFKANEIYKKCQVKKIKKSSSKEWN